MKRSKPQPRPKVPLSLSAFRTPRGEIEASFSYFIRAAAKAYPRLLGTLAGDCLPFMRIYRGVFTVADTGYPLRDDLEFLDPKVKKIATDLYAAIAAWCIKNGLVVADGLVASLAESERLEFAGQPFDFGLSNLDPLPHPCAFDFAMEHLDLWHRYPSTRGSLNVNFGHGGSLASLEFFTLTIDPADMKSVKQLKEIIREKESEWVEIVRKIAKANRIRRKLEVHFEWLADYIIGLKTHESIAAADGKERVWEQLEETAHFCGLKFPRVTRPARRKPVPRGSRNL